MSQARKKHSTMSAYTSVARTYANVNQNLPREYWDYGMWIASLRLGDDHEQVGFPVAEYDHVVVNFFTCVEADLQSLTCQSCLPVDNLQVQWG